MKTKTQRRIEAQQRQNDRDKRSDIDQIRLLRRRPGGVSDKEITRLSHRMSPAKTTTESP